MRPRAILLGILTITLLCKRLQEKKKNRSACWSGKAIPTIPPYKPSKKAITVKSLHPSWAPATNSSQNCAGGSASNYDVISPSSDVAASIARTGLAAPLDLSKLPPYGQLSSRLRDLPLVKSNGQVYGVPFMWGPNPLLYDTTVFAHPRIPGRFFGTRNTRQNLRVG